MDHLDALYLHSTDLFLYADSWGPRWRVGPTALPASKSHRAQHAHEHSSKWGAQMRYYSGAAETGAFPSLLRPTPDHCSRSWPGGIWTDRVSLSSPPTAAHLKYSISQNAHGLNPTRIRDNKGKRAVMHGKNNPALKVTRPHSAQDSTLRGNLPSDVGSMWGACHASAPGGSHTPTTAQSAERCVELQFGKWSKCTSWSFLARFSQCGL